MSLQSLADEYFSNLNSTASRLYTDLQETKSTYEELWSTLSEKEQQTILSESIIKPEVLIKYYKTKPETECRKFALKLVLDDNCSYRDEHSGPFTFRTQSQRDLNLFHDEKPKQLGEHRGRIHKPRTKVYKSTLFRLRAEIHQKLYLL